MYLTEIYDNYNSETLAAIYLDFLMTFEKVCHKRFIDKLFISGFRGNALKLLESYLTDSKQRVRVGQAV